MSLNMFTEAPRSCYLSLDASSVGENCLLSNRLPDQLTKRDNTMGYAERDNKDTLLTKQSIWYLMFFRIWNGLLKS